MLTRYGKKSLEQAKEFGLEKYYDRNMGIYLIPQDEATPEIMSKIMNLVWHGEVYNRRGEVDNDYELVMSIETAINLNTGEEIEDKYDLFIREVEKFH